MAILRMLFSLLLALTGSAGGVFLGMLGGFAVMGWLGVPDADGERALLSGLLFGLPAMVAGFDLGARLSTRRGRSLLVARARRLGAPRWKQAPLRLSWRSSSSPA